VAPEKMAEMLEQVLKKNARLQLVNLQTLPAAPLLEPLLENALAKSAGAKTLSENAEAEPGNTPASAVTAPNKQAFKHGVQITVRGSYLDLLQYLTELEHLPTQMFWGKAEMRVEKYPDVELTLTLYTLSLDKTWLKI
jgi:MSHA biogenesis protein MshJ